MDGFIGEVRLFCGSFAPRGWLLCDGRIISKTQFPYLYAVLRNIYGGSAAQSTFALPDLRGMAAVAAGQGIDLTERKLGANFGLPAVALTMQQIPAHNHSVKAKVKVSPTTLSNDPKGNIWARTSLNIYADKKPDVHMPPDAVSIAGKGAAHNNVQPCVGVNYIICYEGAFPAKE